MSFERSVNDKDRFEALDADGDWHRLTIASRSSQPVSPGGHDFTVHLYGDQDQRASGTIWVRLVRLPSGNSTSWCPFPISKLDPDFGAVLTTFVDIAAAVTAIAVEYRTRVPGLRLKNRVYKSDPR